MHRSTRRNRVAGRSATAAVVCAAVAAIGTTTAGLHPTGQRVVDVVLVFMATAACVWAAASAPWWSLVVVATAATALATGPSSAAVGLVALILPIVIGVEKRNWAWVRSLSAGLSAFVLARLTLHGVFGLSTVIAVGGLGMVFVLGARRRSRSTARLVLRITLATGALTALAGVGLVLAALSAKGDLQRGNDEARSGLDLLAAGDVHGAQSALHAASVSFASAEESLGRPWAQVARVVPILAQNRDAAESLAGAAARTTATLDTIAGRIDLDSLRLTDGRIDLDAVRALDAPLTQVSSLLDDLAGTTTSVDTPWLVSPVRRAVDDLEAQIVKQRARTDDARNVVRVAPDMLGASGSRVYFIAFCTPAEARGSLGFMGNFAELTAQDGRLTLSRFGRTGTDLVLADDGTTRRITGLDEFLTDYGRFGFGSTSGTPAASDVWLDVTMSRDFPTTAQVISQLYPQTGGKKIDGVIALDPTALAGLLQLTGPVAVDGSAQPLTAANAAQFLLVDQYVNASNADRIDALEVLAKSVTGSLLHGPLPAPNALANIFGPLIRSGHLVGWAADGDEESIFSQFHADGALPTLDGRDGIGMSLNNGSGNKIDNFLASSLDYRSIRSANGKVQSTATITLDNKAPTSGFSDYVIGNVVGLPVGTNRTYLTLYSATTMQSATLDGSPLVLRAGTERGWHTYSTFVDLSPGAPRTLVVTLGSDHAFADAPPVRVVPNLPSPTVFTVTAPSS